MTSAAPDRFPVDLSLVIPAYNEEEVLFELHARVRAALDALAVSYEVILVDDGSTDATAAILDQLHAQDPRWKAIHFSRNFGHQMAISAGLEFARGDAVVIMDSDLQDPPEAIAEMVRLWREGADVVYAQRVSRDGESAFKRVTAALYYRLIDRLSPVRIPRDTGDFRLISKRVADVLRRLPERHRFIRGLVSWAGYRQVALPYARERRRAGTTKYPFARMWKFAVEGITSFSHVPLQLATWTGFAVSFVSFLYILHVLWLKLFTDRPVLGWASLMVAVTFMGGVQLLSLGIIGEYLGRVYDEVKGRPPFLIARTTGL